MKNFLALMFSMLMFNSSVLIGQNITLLGSLNPYPGSAYANIWGYAEGGREYALYGSYRRYYNN